MGVYIKGVTKLQLMKVIINSTEFMPDDFEIIEVKTPHGRLMDKDKFKNYILDKYSMSAYSSQMDRFLNELYSEPTVIEAEVE